MLCKHQNKDAQGAPPERQLEGREQEQSASWDIGIDESSKAPCAEKYGGHLNDGGRGDEESTNSSGLTAGLPATSEELQTSPDGPRTPVDSAGVDVEHPRCPMTSIIPVPRTMGTAVTTTAPFTEPTQVTIFQICEPNEGLECI